MERFFLVYKTINKLSGEYYIGVHITSNLNDDYIGSGKRLRYCIKKYGKESFERQTLAIFDNAQEMFQLETELVSEETLKDPLCLNLKVGGYGGWYLKNANLLWRSDLQIKRSPFNKTEWRIKNAENIAKWSFLGLSKGRQKILEMRENGWRSPGFSNKSHNDDFKKMMSQVMSIAQAGEKNSQYGKCWIYSLSEKQSIRVKKEDVQEWLNKGWQLGRKMKFN